MPIQQRWRIQRDGLRPRCPAEAIDPTRSFCVSAPAALENRAAHATTVGTAGASGSAGAGVGHYIYAQSSERNGAPGHGEAGAGP